MKLTVFVSLITLFPMAGICIGDMHLSIMGGCGSGDKCLEMLLEDHNGNKVGFDIKTGESIEGIEGSSYGVDVAPSSLDGSVDSPPFKVLYLVKPRASIYKLNIFGMQSGVYEIIVSVMDYGMLNQSFNVSKKFKGIIDNNEIQAIGITIPINGADGILIEKELDFRTLEREIKIAKKEKIIQDNGLVGYLLGCIKKIKKNENDERFNSVKDQLNLIKAQIIKSKNECTASQTKSHQVAALDAILGDVEILLGRK